MDNLYYDLLRQADQDRFYNAINNSDDDLYDLLWDLFEKVVIESGEIYDLDFRENNQFRYTIEQSATLEFFPESGYFRKRVGANPFRNDSEEAGIHLQFSILPQMSCLFVVSFQIWGAPEKRAFRFLWKHHRQRIATLLDKVKPMIETGSPSSALLHTVSIADFLDSYFQQKDDLNYLRLSYPFAEAEETDSAQDFMVIMALLYHAVRDYCLDKTDTVPIWYEETAQFYSNHIPELPAPLPCVELAIATDAE
jgi:hypothetical protein